MLPDMRTISLGGVNCYLLGAGDGFVLIDTGLAAKRSELVRQLEAAGCAPGRLRLVILTHGDIDHAGNCAHLQATYGAPIAMHRAEAGMAEQGDMSWNRKVRPDRITAFGRVVMTIAGMMVRLSGARANVEVFSPDVFLEDGQSLTAYGLDASVVHIPGHSKGSIGILTCNGELFCGDLMMNMFRPAYHFMIDDLADFEASLVRLKGLEVRTVYPGHGRPFPMHACPR